MNEFLEDDGDSDDLQPMMMSPDAAHLAQDSLQHPEYARHDAEGRVEEDGDGQKESAKESPVVSDAPSDYYTGAIGICMPREIDGCDWKQWGVIAMNTSNWSWRSILHTVLNDNFTTSFHEAPPGRRDKFHQVGVNFALRHAKSGHRAEHPNLFIGLATNNSQTSSNGSSNTETKLNRTAMVVSLCRPGNNAALHQLSRLLNTLLPPLLLSACDKTIIPADDSINSQMEIELLRERQQDKLFDRRAHIEDCLQKVRQKALIKIVPRDRTRGTIRKNKQCSTRSVIILNYFIM